MMKNSHRPFSKIVSFSILVLLLSACIRQPAPVPVSPVTGMPQGTHGLPWWSDTVFYQIFVRSFYDSNGDGIGDFNGIIEKLDYLNDGNPETTSDLGVTGLWLMPIFPSPSYHGYDVTDYYSVNPQYGTMQDFKNLIAEAHKRGIRVTIDLVINHTSIRHPWFIESQSGDESPKRDWYIWSKDNPGFSGPWGQKVWHKLGDAYYYALFWEGMPDLNFENPEVVAEVFKIARFWLEAGVDGFRLDGAKHIVEEGSAQENTSSTHSWWKSFRTFYKGVNPQAVTVGEVWSSSQEVARYLQGDELDLAFNFDLAAALVSAAGNNSASLARNALEQNLRIFKPWQFASFLTNHDQERVMDKVGQDVNRAKVAASLLLTSPGIPFIYYGEEIGMTGRKPDENIRTPMQWSGEANAGFTTSSYPWRLPNMDYKEKNVVLQSSDANSLLSHYRKLIQLRNQHAALRIGDLVFVDSRGRDVLAFLRVIEEEIVLVVINLSKNDISDYALTLRSGPLSGEYRSALMLLTGETSGKIRLRSPEVNSQGGFDAFTPLPEGQSLPAYATLILQLQPVK